MTRYTHNMFMTFQHTHVNLHVQYATCSKKGVTVLRWEADGREQMPAEVGILCHNAPKDIPRRRFMDVPHKQQSETLRPYCAVWQQAL